MILLNLFYGRARASLKDIWYANPGTDFDTEEVAGNWIDKNSNYIIEYNIRFVYAYTDYQTKIENVNEKGLQ